MNRTIKALFIAKDPGGFNAVFPVFDVLRRKNNFSIKYIFDKESSSLSPNKKIRFRRTEKISKKELASFLKNYNPDLLVSGTSAGLSLDKIAIDLLNKSNTQKISIIDFWSNYKDRFSDPGTSNLKYLPDYLLVIDEQNKKELIEEGFPLEKIVITGNPYFDSFKINQNGEGKIISFFSQPFSENKMFKKLGFDEVSVFADLIWAINKIGIKENIVVKLHPKTKNKRKFNSVIKKSGLKIKLDSKSKTEDIINKSILVTGMNSMVLFEAAICGGKVLSYQPNLKIKDPLFSNKLGLSTSVYKKKDLQEKIIYALNKPTKDTCAFDKYVRNKSTEKVVVFIDSLFQVSPAH